MAKGRGRTGATRSGNRAVSQTRGGVGGNSAGFLGPVTTGRGPNHKATGQPIRNGGRPVDQNFTRDNTARPLRTGNPEASGLRTGVGTPGRIRDASGKGVSQTVSPGGAGNFPRVALRTGKGAPRQQTERTKGNVVRAKGRKQGNSGRLGTIGIEYQDGAGNVTKK